VGGGGRAHSSMLFKGHVLTWWLLLCSHTFALAGVIRGDSGLGPEGRSLLGLKGSCDTSTCLQHHFHYLDEIYVNVGPNRMWTAT
jgi:hypothetical protein